MKTRSDAWTNEQDKILAETVLKHIREGSTQLNAFEEVGDTFNRTSAAVGFRWNSTVRYNYNDEVEQAKKYRKQLKRAIASTKNIKTSRYVKNDVINQTSSSETIRVNNNNVNLTNIISYLQKIDVEFSKLSLLEIELENSRDTIQSLKSENENLKAKLNKMNEEYETMQEDYQVLTQILNRARRMVLLDEDKNNSPSHSFRMDKNGNLEKIAN